MVSNIVYGRANKLKVLYSADIDVWKLAGFSLTSRGDSGSRGIVLTRMQRGTSGYRAPELIQVALYTKKVDIWAFGCVTYELVTKRRAFVDDFATHIAGVNFQSSLILRGLGECLNVLFGWHWTENLRTALLLTIFQ